MMNNDRTSLTHIHTRTIFCSHTDLVCVDEANEIYKCRTCGLYSALGTSFRSPDKPDAEELLMDSIEILRRENYQEIISRIHKIFGDDKEIHGLDIGCARGWFLDEAGHKGIIMDGIEPEKNFFIEAKKYGREVINGLFPDDFDFKAERKYDFIIFNDVFEHLPDPDTVLKRCNSLLKTGGILIISCPDSGGIFFRTAKMLHKLGIDSYWRRVWQLDFYSPHLWYFSKKNLPQILTRYNFSEIDFINLKVLTLRGLKQRIMCNAKNLFSGYATYAMITAFSPLLPLLPKDPMCIFFRKM